MSIDVTQDIGKLFSFKPAQMLELYKSTKNCADQVIAADGVNVENIQSTGGKSALINGQPETLEQDAELDISADTTEVSLTAWATATAYSVGDIRQADNGVRVRCIKAHTSSADDEPFVGGNFDQYWEAAPHAAVNANGTIVTNGYAQQFLVTAKADGTLQIWEAGDLTLGTSAVFKCPVFDPKVYVAVASVLYANSDTGAHTIGGASCDFSTYGTFTQIIGSIAPTAENLKKVC